MGLRIVKCLEWFSVKHKVCDKGEVFLFGVIGGAFSVECKVRCTSCRAFVKREECLSLRCWLV